MLLSQDKSIKLLKKYRIKTPKTVLFKQQNVNFLKLKFPVALKVDSPEAIHKSDMGLVHVNIKDIHELNRKLKTVCTVLRMHNITKYGMVVQEMVKGLEIIIGMKRDPTFGSVILFGLGGVFVEVMKDVSMRIAQLTKKDCLEMLDEIKGNKLLQGYRHIKPVNKDKIVDLLLKMSKISQNEKHIQEIDFNPVIVNDRQAIVVDARIIIGDKNVWTVF